MNRTGFLTPYQQICADCSGCGICLPVCPVYKLTGLETDGPRGRVRICQAMANGELAPEAAAAAISRCLLCGRCEQVCPARLPLAGIFVAAHLAVGRFLPVSLRRRAVAAGLLQLTRAQDVLQAPAALLQKTIKSARALPELPLSPFVHRSGEKARILFFPGCLVRRFLPQVAEAAIKALSRDGATVTYAPDAVCCGRPLAVQGNPRRLARAVHKNLAVFARYEFDRIVSVCPGCVATIRKVWPHLPGLTPEERADAARIAANVVDLAELPGEFRQPGGKIFWHRPCLLGQETAARIVARLQPVAGSDAAACCGAPLHCLDPIQVAPAPAGRLAQLLEKRPPDLAESLALRLRREAHGMDCVVTACPGCILSLKTVTKMPVLHIAELAGG